MIEFHRSPEAMARVLIQYISCDRRVREEVYTAWGRKVCLTTIREMREVRARQTEAMQREGTAGKSYDARGWDWRGDQHEDEMARASTRFIQAIEREKALAAPQADQLRQRDARDENPQKSVIVENCLLLSRRTGGSGESLAVNGCPLSQGGLG